MKRNRRKIGRSSVAGVFATALLMASAALAAIVLGQVDDFEDGTTQGWVEGGPSPNPPVNVPDGGPGGAGDNYLENDSSGLAGPGGNMTMFNQTQWTGDFTAAGVNVITAQMANFGATHLHMRLAVEGGADASRFGSTVAVELPPDGQWYPVMFDLIGMELISGTNSLSEVLASVDTLRIVSAESGPAWGGDQIEATLGTDVVLATRVPVSGMVAGSALRGYQCRNLTTGQTVIVNEAVGTLFDCESEGLDVNLGDRVLVRLLLGAE